MDDVGHDFEVYGARRKQPFPSYCEIASGGLVSSVGSATSMLPANSDSAHEEESSPETKESWARGATQPRANAAERPPSDWCA